MIICGMERKANHMKSHTTFIQQWYTTLHNIMNLKEFKF